MTAPPIVVRRFEARDVAAIARLNQRLADGGSSFMVYGEAPGEAGERADLPRERLFVAVEGDEIRGAVYLREARLSVDGATVPVGWVKYPVSESLVNRAYAGVPATLLLHLSRLQPRLVAVGLGGHGGPFAQLLARFRWVGDVVPTFVLPLNVPRVIAALPHLRRTPSRRHLVRGLRWSGAAWLAGRILPALSKRRSARLSDGASAEATEDFEVWADTLWDEVAAAYPVGIVRDAAWLRWMYPTGAPGVARLRIRAADRTIGWAVTQFLDLREAGSASPYGPVVLGVLHDMFGASGDAERIVACAVASLVEQGADLVISQHSHPDWQAALARAGFRSGPASFACYRSPAMSKAIGELDLTSWYITRGDDGIFAL